MKIKKYALIFISLLSVNLSFADYTDQEIDEKLKLKAEKTEISTINDKLNEKVNNTDFEKIKDEVKKIENKEDKFEKGNIEESSTISITGNGNGKLVGEGNISLNIKNEAITKEMLSPALRKLLFEESGTGTSPSVDTNDDHSETSENGNIIKDGTGIVNWNDSRNKDFKIFTNDGDSFEKDNYLTAPGSDSISDIGVIKNISSYGGYVGATANRYLMYKYNNLLVATDQGFRKVSKDLLKGLANNKKEVLESVDKKLELYVVGTDKIENNAITEEKISNNSVSTKKIQDKAITEEKLADNSVSTRTIQDKAITKEKLADGVITESKISDNSITYNKLGNDVKEMMTTTNSGIANAIAIASLPKNLNDSMFNISLSTGYFNKVGGFAVGLTGTTFNRNFVYHTNFAINTKSQFSLGAGISYSFGYNKTKEITNKAKDKIAYLEDRNKENEKLISSLIARLERLEEENDDIKKKTYKKSDVIMERKKFVIYGFSNNETKLSNSQEEALLSFIKKIKENKIKELNLVGINENSEENYVGLKRAESVKNFLVKNGIDKNLIKKIEGKMDNKKSSSENNKNINMRVDIILTYISEE